MPGEHKLKDKSTSAVFLLSKYQEVIFVQLYLFLASSHLGLSGMRNQRKTYDGKCQKSVPKSSQTNPKLCGLLGVVLTLNSMIETWTNVIAEPIS